MLINTTQVKPLSNSRLAKPQRSFFFVCVRPVSSPHQRVERPEDVRRGAGLVAGVFRRSHSPRGYRRHLRQQRRAQGVRQVEVLDIVDAVCGAKKNQKIKKETLVNETAESQQGNSLYPTTYGGTQNGSSVGKYPHCIHVFARLAPNCMLSKCLLK